MLLLRTTRTIYRTSESGDVLLIGQIAIRSEKHVELAWPHPFDALPEGAIGASAIKGKHQ